MLPLHEHKQAQIGLSTSIGVSDVKINLFFIFKVIVSGFYFDTNILNANLIYITFII